jgi:hypothetical protein
MPKRPLLLVGAGVAVITVLEGIACGNPVAPRCPGPRCAMPIDAPSDAPSDGITDGPLAVPGDGGIDDAAKP